VDGAIGEGERVCERGDCGGDDCVGAYSCYCKDAAGKDEEGESD